MRRLTSLLLVAGWSFATGFAQAPQAPPERKLEITFEGSNVTLRAANVSLPEILAEWGRLSGCVMVNADRLSRVPIIAPIQFDNQPQQRVLESLLRPAAGFILTARKADRPGATDFEAVFILATSAPSQSSYPGMTTQAPISNVDTSEVPPIPPPPPPTPESQQPPAASRPTTSPGVYVQPIIAVPPSNSTGRAGTPPPPTTTTTGRGGGGGR
jgi:hypothetical protein